MKIINKVLFILIILFSFSSANAQFSVGLFGGANNTGLIGDAPQGSTYRDHLGFGIGVLGEYKFTSDVGLSIQPMFIQKGVNIAYSVRDQREPQDSIEIIINYFSVPILIKVYAGNEIMYVSGGIDIGYKLNASFRRIPSESEKDISDSFKDFNIAAIFGVGAQFRFSQFHIFVEGRYSQGLGNISNPNPGEPEELNPSFRTSGLQLYAGLIYSFGNNKK